VTVSPLTLEWIEKSVEQSLFREAFGQRDGKDPYRLGWELLKPTRDVALDIAIADVPWASAEGVVALASLTEAVRRKLNARFNEPIQSNPVIDALRLEQLRDGIWADPETPQSSQADELHIDPLRRWELISLRRCTQVAQFLGDRAATILQRLSSSNSSVVTAVQLIVEQALLNVYQHAYEDTMPIAFSSITVLQTADWLEYSSMLTLQEQRWLRSSTEYVLEVSIADYGLGIPATLWKAFSGAFPIQFGELQRKSAPISTTAGKHARAQLQQVITNWAFAHDSTRRTDAEFDDQISRLNWRGLHRALNIVAGVNGAIIVRSGQARAGYAFSDGGEEVLDTLHKNPRKEFPGTAVSIRIPITTEASPRAHNEPLFSDQTTLTPYAIVSSRSAAADLFSTPRGSPVAAAICHPFVNLSADDCGTFLNLVRSIPPNIIQIHTFIHLEHLDLLAQLHGFKEDLDFDLPRILCFWSPGEKPQWKFVGLLPSVCRSFIATIERGDTAAIPDHLVALAEQLLDAYSPFVIIDHSGLRLDVATVTLDELSVDRALQLSFESFVATSPTRSWLTEETHSWIRLRNGKLVKRYINILELLYANDILARSVGSKLSRILNRFGSDNPGMQVMTDSEASYFLARHLLKEQEPSAILRSADVHFQQHGPTVVFSDGVYRGETLKQFVARVATPLAAICGVDLRGPGTSDDADLSLTPLLKLPFDPIEVSESDITPGISILEVDQITLAPCTPVNLDDYDLGTNSDRSDFIQRHPELLRYGIHSSGGRVQVVSQSMEAFLHSHSDRLTAWIADEIANARRFGDGSKPPRDIVLFTRADSTIAGLLPSLAHHIAQRFRAKVFSSTLPAAPSKSRQVFARSDPRQNILADVQLLGKQGSLTFEHPTEYIAVLLDDAAVTGKGLVHFMIRCAEASIEYRPLSVVAIPVFTRLNPAEDYLYQKFLRTLGPATDASAIPFRFAPLFRLSVKSFDDLAATMAGKYLASLLAYEHAVGSRLGRYFAVIKARLEEAEQATGSICSHPFFAGPLVPDHNVMSIRIIWIRQLIALYEQNVAVLGHLLHEIRAACTENDYSLLTMFAVEPGLLNLRPLRRSCHGDIADLAMRTLNDSQPSPMVKSDALVVLFSDEMLAPEAIGDIAAAVSIDDNLLDQFLVMLLAHTQGRPNAHGPIANAVYGRVTQPDALLLIKSSLRAWDDLSQSHLASDPESSARAVVRAIAHYIYHAPGDREFTHPTKWIQTPLADRAQQMVTDIIGLFRPAISGTREYFLPALRGLEYIARQQHDGRAASTFREAFNRLIQILAELEQRLDAYTTTSLDEKEISRLEELWTDVKECTQFGPPQDYLVMRPSRNESAGVLEIGMPKFFCLPTDVATRLLRVFGRPNVRADWQETPSHGLEAVVLHSPLAPVEELFELLFEDARSHGTGEIEVKAVRSTHKSELKVYVKNIIAKDRRTGNGRSQERVQHLAMQNKWSVVFPSLESNTELYVVEITFPRIHDLRRS
jgi:hypothetical protein